jgi:maleylpyruvate isomerase
MNDWQRDLKGAVAAHAQLASALSALTDEQAAQPSLLPGWSVGHVLTHIARNADGFTLMVEAANRGEIGTQYPGGVAQRNADIEAGAGRNAAELVADVLAASARLEAAWAATTEASRQAEGLTVAGPVPISSLPSRRRRETLVHHADLGLAYSWRDWPDDYVRLELAQLTMLWASRKPMGLTTLPAAAMALSDHERVAWLLGRTTVEGLEPAGIF